MASKAEPDKGGGYRVLATRPEQQNQSWCRLLALAGFATLALPVLAIEPVQEPAQRQAIKNLILDFDQFDKVVFVSQNAVRETLVWLDDYWPQLPMGIEYFAVGTKTAAALRDYGIAATACYESMNSEELLRLVPLQQLEGQKILICRGVGGRPLLGLELEARGARVSYAELYHRALPAGASETLRSSDFLAAGWREVLSAFSGESLVNLTKVLEDGARASWLNLPLLIPGSRVAQQAADLGFTEIITASNATDEAMLAALLDWRAATEATLG